MKSETATVLIGSRSAHMRALQRGDRLANGRWPELPDVWYAARLIEGRMRGTEGIAAHVGGDSDYWRFQYVTRGPLGAKVIEQRVYRTAVAIMPTRKPSLFPRIHAR